MCARHRPSEPAASLPGAERFDPALSQRLADAVLGRGPAYEPRTRHRLPDKRARYTNRLILETSPYLLQHAHNPVSWYPWGDEAFAKAQREGKPILLSVGYSTCHWCHVMEEESFEDEEIATYLNRHYVAIKVDREERPDIDGVYMAAVQRLTGRGGWPMTVWLTSQRKPFFGGTYFPPRDGVRGARTGFLSLLERLRDEHRGDPASVAAKAAQLVAALEQGAAPSAGGVPGASSLRAAAMQLASSFDSRWGGFGGAPKFPRPATLELLLRYHRRTGDAAALEMVSRTLERMAAGGMYDQIGGGFHRYSVDAEWRVPHFEKMLYDNAQLVLVYLEAFQLTGREDFARVVRETLDYVLRDMTSPEGGFYSATDADSEGEEGTYFVWTPEDIDRVLGPERGRVVTSYFDVTAAGNFEHGKSVLWRPRPVEEVASRLGQGVDAVRATIAAAGPPLFAARAQRPPPLWDRKILVAWNGLMISAFARAAIVLGEARYQQAAQKAASFLMSRARDKGRLLHSVSEGRAAGDAFLDDYAFLAAGLLDLLEADPDPQWLVATLSLQAELDRGFGDERAGGYFFTASHHERLLVREKPDYDGALPAGNSVAALNLLRLFEATSDPRYREAAEGTLRAFGAALIGTPSALPRMLLALDFLLDRPKQVVIVSPSGLDARDLLARFRRVFLPNRVLFVAQEGEHQRRLAEIVSLVTDKVAQGGRPTAYVCLGTQCELPTADPEVFERQLRKIDPLPSASP
jgi:uncharacterized protein YyaL (SSP411 family)